MASLRHPQGGGCIFIYSGSARLISFEINFISKQTSRARPEYINIHPPINALATALVASCQQTCCKLIISTGLLQLVSKSCNKSANDKL